VAVVRVMVVVAVVVGIELEQGFLLVALTQLL
jgi:hypothetical protein